MFCSARALQSVLYMISPWPCCEQSRTAVQMRQNAMHAQATSSVSRIRPAWKHHALPCAISCSAYFQKYPLAVTRNTLSARNVRSVCLCGALCVQAFDVLSRVAVDPVAPDAAFFFRSLE